MKNEVANRIKELRAKRGLTLEQVGNFVGVGKSTVRKWETGMIENMRRDKIASLAKILGTTPADLMGWDDSDTEIPPIRNFRTAEHKKEGDEIMSEKNVINVVDVDTKKQRDGYKNLDIPLDCYNAIISIKAVTHSSVKSIVSDLLRFAISRTTIVSNGETIMDCSQLNLENPKMKMK